MICVETGLDMTKNSVLTIILPVMGEKPAPAIAAMNTDMTAVVVQVEDVCKRV